MSRTPIYCCHDVRGISNCPECLKAYKHNYDKSQKVKNYQKEYYKRVTKLKREINNI